MGSSVSHLPADFTPRPLTGRKLAIRDHSDRMAPERAKWLARNAFYYEDDRTYMRFLVPEGLSILELGCGNGHLLAELNPSRGVGIDISPGMVDEARKTYPHLEFAVADMEDPDVLRQVGGPFDVIILSDSIGYLDDCQKLLESLHELCTPSTRIIIAYYSRLWEPLIRLGARIGLKMPQPEQNWLSSDDIVNLLQLADFDIIKREWRQLIPKKLLGLGPLVNATLGALPMIRRACLRNYVVARSLRVLDRGHKPSVTVLVPCRNEAGNIEAAVTRTPRFAPDMEILFVEGNSQDNTVEEIERVIAAYPQYDIKFLKQDGKGKGDAVRKGFRHARGDVLMILDADLTMPPEDLPKFYDALASGKGEFINGTRLVYPMEKEAMRFLNLLANRGFSLVFSWLLNQRFTDTLCGTKVIRKSDYQQLEANRSYFGEFDPFGDYDLIFGASKLNLKVVEIPIRYAARTYGSTQISRFADGWLLLRMVVVAYRKLKAFV